jgi:hypothetical protein
MKYEGRWLKRKFEELRQQFGGKCQCDNPECSKTGNLEFAHVEPTKLKGWSRGKKVRYYDILNHPDCYVLLTKECHRKFDRGELTVKTNKKRS